MVGRLAWVPGRGALDLLRNYTPAAPTPSGLATTFPDDGAGAPSGWTLQNAVGSVAVTGGALTLTSATGAYAGAPAVLWSQMTPQADFEVIYELTIGALVEQYPVVAFRADTGSGQYPTNGLAIEHQPAASANHWLASQIVGGTKTQLAAGDFSYVAGTPIHVRERFVGGAWQMRMWTGTTEPTTWLLDISGAAVTAAGRMYLGSNNGGAGTATVFSVDNIAVTPIASTAVPMPTSEPAGFTRIWSEDFDVAYPVGSFAAHDVSTSQGPVGTIDSSSPAASRYASKISVYPDGGLDTGHYAQYYASKTLSTQSAPGANGVLDIYCHTETVAGTAIPMGAWVRPLTPNDVDQRLTYGRFSFRAKFDLMPTWGGVFLTIAKTWPDGGEDDWPEFEYTASPPVSFPPGGGNYHYADPANVFVGVPTTAFPSLSGVDFRAWHVWTQEWKPSRIRYLMDDVVYWDTTDRVGSTPRQHVYQVGGDHSVPTSTVSGHVQIDWWTVAAWTG